MSALTSKGFGVISGLSCAVCGAAMAQRIEGAAGIMFCENCIPRPRGSFYLCVPNCTAPRSGAWNGEGYKPFVYKVPSNPTSDPFAVGVPSPGDGPSDEPARVRFSFLDNLWQDMIDEVCGAMEAESLQALPEVKSPYDAMRKAGDEKRFDDARIYKDVWLQALGRAAGNCAIGDLRDGERFRFIESGGAWGESQTLLFVTENFAHYKNAANPFGMIFSSPKETRVCPVPVNLRADGWGSDVPLYGWVHTHRNTRGLCGFEEAARPYPHPSQFSLFV